MTPLRGLSKVEPLDLQNPVDHWQHFQTGDFGQKWNSSKLIVREGKDAIAPLLHILNDPEADAETHWFTIRALGNFPDPEVIAAIAAQIGDNPHYINRTAEQTAELSAFAIETLAAMGTLAIDVLSQLLQIPERRLLAAKALNQVRSSGVIPAMVSVASDENAMVRYYAVDALGSFHNTAVTSVLLAALKDPAANVRKAAVMALGRRGDLQAEYQLSQQLQPLLWDIDVTVSCQAALALGRLGSDDTLEVLQQILLSEHTPMALRFDTVRALEWYCDALLESPSQYVRGDGAADATALDILSEALVKFASGLGEAVNGHGLSAQENAQIQVAIIRVLGELCHGPMAQRATEVLIQRLQNQPDAMVAQAIIMALANLGQPQAFDALLPLLRHPADAVPIHAVAALKRLDPDHSLTRVTTYIEGCPEHTTDVIDFW
ncbi:MAG: HEAT repeat domain-containing protein [Cyanobacteria bacterium P01_C01_bin.118]